MNDIDNRLRSQLHEIGDEIDPSSQMPPRVGTRVRRRRALTVGALGVAVVVLALTATVVVGSLDRDALDPAEERATTPAPPEEGNFEGQVVAWGSYDDSNHWFVFAYRSEGGVDRGGDLCVGDGTYETSNRGIPRGYGCGRFYPGRIGLSISSGSEDPTIGYGQVGVQVDRLIAVYMDGTEENVRLWDAPDGFPFAAKFYALFPLPDGITGLKAYSGDTLVAERDVGGHAFPKQTKVTPRTLLAQGNHGGEPWGLRVQMKASGEQGPYPCGDVWFGKGQAHGGGGSCWFSIQRKGIEVTETTFETKPEVVAMFGAVSKEAVRVEIKLGGRPIEAEIFVGPEDHPVDYFIVFIDREVGESPQGFAEAYDLDGHLLGRDKLCTDLGTGSTCG